MSAQQLSLEGRLSAVFLVSLRLSRDRTLLL